MLETISRSLLTFLLNSTWQIAVVGGSAALACRLLRKNPGNHLHAIWVTALLLAMVLPLASVRRLPLAEDVRFETPLFETRSGLTSAMKARKTEPLIAGATTPVAADVSLAKTTAGLVLSAYLLCVLLGLGRLLRASLGTMRLRSSATTSSIPDRLNGVRRRCEEAFGVHGVPLLFSEELSGPVTVGRVIILPESLLRETSEEVLTAAIGHEMAHIGRHDFPWNVAYELLYVLLSFHPAVWLIRRSIERTREMACDEMVTRRLMDAGIYARSILSLAKSMMALRSPGYSLGVFDGDILEMRIQRMLEGRTASLRIARLLLASGLTVVGICAILASD